jgi:hypothetical protein
MRARGVYRAAALLAAVLFASPLCAKKDGPDFKVTHFTDVPFSLSYFKDSESLLFQDPANRNVYRSADAGASWDRVDAVPEGKAALLYMHDYDPERAYILTTGTQHYRTHDRGKTWKSFQSVNKMSMFRPDILQFHASIPDRIIFNAMVCDGMFCDEVAMYTDDGFKSEAKFLRGTTSGCWWAKASLSFSTGDETLDKHRILCLALDPHSPRKHDQRLLISDNYFQPVNASDALDEFEPNLDTNRPVQGIINVAVVKKFLLAAAISANTDEMALFVTDDSVRWHRAVFPTDHRLEQGAYTALESTEYSIQIDVMTTRPSNPMGVLFTSNSNGTYFTRNIEHTNRNMHGHVDFEKIAGIQGIFLLNKVENWEDLEKNPNAKKKIVTEITFDDGRTFEEVKVDGKRLHLHSVTEPSNIGRVFSSPAPGLVMGVGNTGEALTNYWDGDLFVSDNAGLTWTKALDGPHQYEFGDQGSILVTVRDSKEFDVTEIGYSLDHGQNWKTASLPDDAKKIKPWLLTTSQDSTTLKFILVGGSRNDDKPFSVISIDFEGMQESTCGKSDMEDWFARVDDDGKPTCLMGHTQKFHRRKKNADCFLKEAHKEIDMETTDCECSDQDFECDYNFVRDGKDCVTKVPISPPDGSCKKPDDKFMGPSGWRLIPGNTCNRKSGKQKDDKVERECSDAGKPGNLPASGEVVSNQQVFKGDWNGMEKHYLERGDSSAGADETVIVRPRQGDRGRGDIWITQNHGKDWTKPKNLPHEEIEWILPHHYFKDMVFFVTRTKTVYYTADRGQNFHSFEAPHPAALEIGQNPLAFHPDNKNWLLWMGKKCEDKDCHLEVSFSKDRGDNWQTGARYVEYCEFTGSDAFKYPDRKVEQIICLQRARENTDKGTPVHLVSSNDWFDHQETLHENVKSFATMAEFIVAATENAEKKTLQAHASLDGGTMAEAKFPSNFEVPHQHAYTVLDSSTHAVNLFVVTETKADRKYGSIMKSNSNGTSYVLSIANVNCDEKFYVDFEKMLGLEGVALVNTVNNPDANDAPKQLQTKITHNDGAEWTYLPPPSKDVDGKSFKCSSKKGDTKCALHIHGYTERLDHRKMYSSKSAVGLMFGWGNVDSTLGPAKEADTFMTTDAGITWKQVKKGRWTWAVGDQGSIIVLVQVSPNVKKTNIVSYSTDEGATWTDYKFSDEEVEIIDVATMRSGNSRNVLLIGRSDAGVFTINLDFSGLSDRECKHDENDDSKSDYYLWSPKHPLQDTNCLFGHVKQYLRKKPEKSCYNNFKMEHIFKEENCACTREDYEW